MGTVTFVSSSIITCRSIQWWSF